MRACVHLYTGRIHISIYICARTCAHHVHVLWLLWWRAPEAPGVNSPQLGWNDVQMHMPASYKHMPPRTFPTNPATTRTQKHSTDVCGLTAAAACPTAWRRVR